ncbi:hypothetical protein [Streptomyces sp. NPDC058861]|uniref:hypothetical protein n=1 Tax=Streptomyces sp. NPDC058861 TaxID=3346653 RepID=UPI0036C649FA
MTTPEGTTGLHREPAPIAPIAPAAWAGIEEEARRRQPVKDAARALTALLLAGVAVLEA